MPSPPPLATIFALSTPPGRAAIAVVRISGVRALEVVAALCPPLPELRRASLRRLKDPFTGILLDKSLVITFASPRTETGEDMAELHLHGGRAVVRAVLDTLAAFEGCRPAEPGEFANRAFANGKLDLAQVEGLADLIDAETESQRRQAVAITTGAQSKRFERWRDQLLAALALVEASIDFSDEGDVSTKAIEQAEAQARTLADDLKAHLADGHRGEIAREGFRVVLAGPPNAGKSSLLNALARREAAIVSEEAGTTRDIVEVRLDLEGLAVIVQDTAGLRETSSKVEQEGIRRSLQAAREADLVLWLVDAEHREGNAAEHRAGSAAVDDPAPANHSAGENAIHVLTKSDLIHVKHADKKEGSLSGQPSSRLKGGPSEAWFRQDSLSREANSPYEAFVSAKTGAGLDELTRLIASRAREAIGDPHAPAITQARHRQEIANAVLHLDAFLKGRTQAIELRAEELRLASLALERLTGRLDAEDILGAIFSRFCIGK